MLTRSSRSREAVLRLALNDRQRRAVLEVRTRERIANADYQRLTGTTRKTASRDLDDLVNKGVFTRLGTTGRGTHYVLAVQGVIKRTNETQGQPGVQEAPPTTAQAGASPAEEDINGTNRTASRKKGAKKP